MTSKNIEEEVSAIDAAIREFPWMDFEVLECNGRQLIVTGSVDESASHDIEIRFEGVYFVSMPMQWKTDTSGPVLALLGGEEARTLNERFQVERGYFIFCFRPEYHPEDFGCLVGAKGIMLHRTPKGTTLEGTSEP